MTSAALAGNILFPETYPDPVSVIDQKAKRMTIERLGIYSHLSEQTAAERIKNWTTGHSKDLKIGHRLYEEQYVYADIMNSPIAEVTADPPLRYQDHIEIAVEDACTYIVERVDVSQEDLKIQLAQFLIGTTIRGHLLADLAEGVHGPYSNLCNMALGRQGRAIMQMGKLNCVVDGVSYAHQVVTPHGMIEVYRGEETWSGTWRHKVTFQLARKGGSKLAEQEIIYLRLSSDFYTLSLQERSDLMFDIMYHCRVHELFLLRAIKRGFINKEMSIKSLLHKAWRSATESLRMHVLHRVFGVVARSGINTSLKRGIPSLMNVIITQISLPNGPSGLFLDKRLNILESDGTIRIPFRPPCGTVAPTGLVFLYQNSNYVDLIEETIQLICMPNFSLNKVLTALEDDNYRGDKRWYPKFLRWKQLVEAGNLIFTGNWTLVDVGNQFLLPIVLLYRARYLNFHKFHEYAPMARVNNIKHSPYPGVNQLLKHIGSGVNRTYCYIGKSYTVPKAGGPERDDSTFVIDEEDLIVESLKEFKSSLKRKRDREQDGEGTSEQHTTKWLKVPDKPKEAQKMEVDSSDSDDSKSDSDEEIAELQPGIF